MWKNFSTELAAMKDFSYFPIIAREDYAKYTDLFKGDIETSSVASYKNIFHALKVIPVATSEKFFSQLPTVLYFIPSLKNADEMRTLVNQILSRYQFIFGRETQLYFDLKQHQIAWKYGHGSESIPHLYQTIAEIKKLQLDPTHYEERLINILTDAGFYEKALPLAEEKLESALSKLKPLEKTDVAYGILYQAGCSAALNITKIQTKIHGEFDENLLISNCLNNFKWPPPFDENLFSYQVYIEFLHALLDRKSKLSQNKELQQRLRKYSAKTLEAGEENNFMLVPLAVFNMATTEKLEEKIILKKRFLTSLNFENLPSWFAEEEASLKWMIKASEIFIEIDSSEDDFLEEFALATFEFFIEIFQPSISSPISNLDASEKGLDFERLANASMFMRETGNSSFLKNILKSQFHKVWTE